MGRKIFFTLCLIIFCCALHFGDKAISASMFDENGSYSGNWKQMTNVSSSPSSSNKYKSSDYSSSAWYANNRKQQAQKQNTSFSNENYTQTSAVPFRYNTLNYTRIRKVKGGYGDYNAKCSDIGDVSFCH